MCFDLGIVFVQVSLMSANFESRGVSGQETVESKSLAGGASWRALGPHSLLMDRIVNGSWRYMASLFLSTSDFLDVFVNSRSFHLSKSCVICLMLLCILLCSAAGGSFFSMLGQLGDWSMVSQSGG